MINVNFLKYIRIKLIYIFMVVLLYYIIIIYFSCRKVV
jgi:hypothetical protein